MLQNLIDNAIKFSPNHGVVLVEGEVVARPEAALTAGSSDDTIVGAAGQQTACVVQPNGQVAGHWVRISVTDSGAGIPAHFQASIFDLWSQAPSGRGRGSGVGLAFCKLVVEAHGGTIAVKSAMGQGATFSLTLPIASVTK
ncbi:MAG: hypothetical protein NVS4B8_27240 [Herpetosiphon sp.]